MRGRAKTSGRVAVLLMLVFAWLMAVGDTYAADALAILNQRRASRGLPPFKRNPVAQARAERNVAIRSSNGRKGHLRGGPVCRGVGWTTSSPLYFNTCYAGMQGTREVGAAYARGSNGTYFALTW